MSDDVDQVVAELIHELDVPDVCDEAEALTYIRAAYGAGYTDGVYDAEGDAA